MKNLSFSSHFDGILRVTLSLLAMSGQFEEHGQSAKKSSQVRDNF